MLTIQHGVVHPTINYQTPDPDCDLDYVPNTAREMQVRRAISNSFGFGGHNCCLVVGAYLATDYAAPERSCEAVYDLARSRSAAGAIEMHTMTSPLDSLPARAGKSTCRRRKSPATAGTSSCRKSAWTGRSASRRRRVLLIGAGGLGSPLGLYLAAAGVGRIGLVDFDVVDFSNLQRQVLHGTADVGRPKLHSARDRLQAINPEVRVDLYETHLTSANALEIFEPYDIVIDGTDNFPTRYLVNDACVLLKQAERLRQHLPLRRPGVGVLSRPQGPCYRCLYPEPPPPGEVPSCAEGGVLGILPGLIGCIQATEAVKLILGQGEPLIGRLLLYDALQMSFREFKVRRNPKCPMCGDKPTIKQLIDYEQFCGVRGQEAPAAAAVDRRRDDGRGAETAPRPRREGVHPRRAQPGGVSRSAASPAAR